MRDEAGVSSYELARRAGVSQPTVMNWERRERAGTITLASLRRAAEALDCDFSCAMSHRKPVAQSDVNKGASKGRAQRNRKAPKTIPPREAALVTLQQRVQSMDPNSIWE